MVQKGEATKTVYTSIYTGLSWFIILCFCSCVCVFQYCKDILSFKFTCFPKIHTHTHKITSILNLMLAELVVLVIWVKHVVASCDKWCLNLLGTVLKLLALPSDLRVLCIICLYTQCTCCLYLLYLWDNSFFFVSQGKGIPSIDELEYLAEACIKCIQSWVPPAVWNVFAPHQKNLPRSLRLQTCQKLCLVFARV